MSSVEPDTLAARSREELLRRNGIFEEFFEQEVPRLAEACHEMSRRFMAGGRLLAFGNGSAATDAQHVSVEFVHPVIVGKRALPALDLGPNFETGLPVVLKPEDMVMGFAFPEKDADGGTDAVGSAGAGRIDVRADGRSRRLLLRTAGRRSVSCAKRSSRSSTTCSGRRFTCTSSTGSRATTWEHLLSCIRCSAKGSSGSKRSFGRCRVRCSRRWRRRTGCGPLPPRRRRNPIAGDHRRRRGAVWSEEARSSLSVTVGRPRTRTTWSPTAWPRRRVWSLFRRSHSPPRVANITAIANDIGTEAIFTRQLIAHARPEDVAIGISTSGGSANILAALAEARKRGLLDDWRSWDTTVAG